MLYGKELAQSIQKRCRIQPGMLVSVPWSTDTERWVKKSALVIGLSPGCKFDRDYEGAEDHIFYYCKPLDGSQVFVDYVCNMEKIQ
jgi:hypothetical protein